MNFSESSQPCDCEKCQASDEIMALSSKLEEISEPAEREEILSRMGDLSNKILEG